MKLKYGHDSAKLITRRKLLTGMGIIAASAVMPNCYGVNRSGAPNRKVLSINALGIITCENSEVVASEKLNRLATVSDFDNRPTCELMRNSMDGPYFICTNPLDPKIAVGKVGVPLIFSIRAMNAVTCKPIANAVIDIWHCDAAGVYSGYPPTGGPIAPHVEPTTADRHCRGALMTDAEGIVEFYTIYPGWYPGRAVHIHLKAHIGNVMYMTNQVHLPELTNETVFQQAPYTAITHSRVPNSAEPSLKEIDIINRNGQLMAIMNVAFNQ